MIGDQLTNIGENEMNEIVAAMTQTHMDWIHHKPNGCVMDSDDFICFS